MNWPTRHTEENSIAQETSIRHPSNHLHSYSPQQSIRTPQITIKVSRRGKEIMEDAEGDGSDPSSRKCVLKAVGQVRSQSFHSLRIIQAMRYCQNSNTTPVPHHTIPFQPTVQTHDIHTRRYTLLQALA